MSVRLLLGSYTPVTTLVDYTPPSDGKQPSITLVKELPIANASWLTRHPKIPNIWYACIEEDDGGGTVLDVEGSIACYTISKDGDVEQLGQVSTVENPCHIEVVGDAKGLAVANYTGGSAILQPLNDDGTFASKETCNYVKYPQLGEQKPRAHMCVDVPSKEECWISDTSSDCIWRMKISGEGANLKWEIAGNEKSIPRHAPRQFVVSPDARHIYAIQARSCVVSHHDLSKPQDQQLVSTHSILPNGQTIDLANRGPPPNTLGAAINYHAPSKTLLATSRMVRNEPVDTIGVFKVQDDGSIIPHQLLRPSRGKEYRGVGIYDDTYLVAGQTDGWLSCFQWDGELWQEREFSKPVNFPKVVDIKVM